MVIYMDIKQNRFLIKENSYIVDLFNVDFITFKENEKDFGSYWIKLHIGSKEVRYICDDINKLKEIVELWCEIHGKTISLDEKELVGENQWD